MRELRVSLTNEQWKELEICRSLLGVATIKGAVDQLLFLGRPMLEQIRGGGVMLIPQGDLRRIDGLLRQEFARAKEHIHNPATPAEEPRTITLKLKLTPDPSRERVLMEPSASTSFPGIKGHASNISLGSPVGGNGSPVQLELTDGGGPDWIVATDGERFEAHPTDAELFPGWVFWAGPFKRPEAELQARLFNERGAADVFGDEPPSVWPVIIRGALAAAPEEQPSTQGNGRKPRRAKP